MSMGDFEVAIQAVGTAYKARLTRLEGQVNEQKQTIHDLTADVSDATKKYNKVCGCRGGCVGGRGVHIARSVSSRLLFLS